MFYLNLFFNIIYFHFFSEPTIRQQASIPQYFVKKKTQRGRQMKSVQSTQTSNKIITHSATPTSTCAASETFSTVSESVSKPIFYDRSTHSIIESFVKQRNYVTTKTQPHKTTHLVATSFSSSPNTISHRNNIIKVPLPTQNIKTEPVEPFLAAQTETTKLWTEGHSSEIAASSMVTQSVAGLTTELTTGLTPGLTKGLTTPMGLTKGLATPMGLTPGPTKGLTTPMGLTAGRANTSGLAPGPTKGLTTPMGLTAGRANTSGLAPGLTSTTSTTVTSRDDLPPGWTMSVVQRLTGATAGRSDIYYYRLVYCLVTEHKFQLFKTDFCCFFPPQKTGHYPVDFVSKRNVCLFLLHISSVKRRNFSCTGEIYFVD